MIELVKPAKCDFCDNQAVGYGLMQSVFFCNDHVKQAEEVEEIVMAEYEQFLDKLDESYAE